MVTERRVDEVLAHPFDHVWTIQGFGMLRTYLDPDEVDRLHIWDTDTAVPEVSVIHDHPWDFDSRIVHGKLINQRYAIEDERVTSRELVKAAKIKTGEGGGLVPSSVRVRGLRSYLPEIYEPGDTYHMDAPEIHESIPSTGTVTLISRKFHTARDDQFATVCWREGEWVSAEPRRATYEEIMHFIHLVQRTMIN